LLVMAKESQAEEVNVLYLGASMKIITALGIAVLFTACTQLQQDRVVRMKCDCLNSTMECSGTNIKIDTTIEGY